MCCRRRQQLTFPQPRQRGCCGARRQRRLLEAAAVNTSLGVQSQEVSQISQPVQRPAAMVVALLAVGIGIGAEKLGRKISEKRIERKEKKTAAVSISRGELHISELMPWSQEREAIYGSSEASSSSGRATQKLGNGHEKKREEARRELEEARRQDDLGRRRSASVERYSEDGPPPPSYEDAIRHNERNVRNS